MLIWYSFYPETSNLSLEEIDYLFTSEQEVSELGQERSSSTSSQHELKE